MKASAGLLTGALIALIVACGGDDDEGDGGDGSPTAANGPSDSITVTAMDNVYDVQPASGQAGTIEAPANTEFTVTLVNDGGNPHDIDFYTAEDGELLSEAANGDILLEDEETTFSFTTPEPGTYYFLCSVHPTEMFGDFTVQ